MANILFLAHRVPYPPDRGDKIRGFNILKHLAGRHRVHLVAFAEQPTDLKAKTGLNPYTASRTLIWRRKGRVAATLQALIQRKPASLTAFANAQLAQAVQGLMGSRQIDAIYVFSSQMAQYVPERGRARVLLDFVDVDSAKFAAYAEARRGPMRWLYAREARLLLAADRAAARRADASLFVSEAEAALFRNLSGADNVHAIENGIDTLTYDPDARFLRVDSPGRLIVFTGQMDYPPNVEAVRWFAEAILPHVRVRFPDVRFAIVGRAPTAEVQALGREPGVIVTGAVPDVRGWIAAAAVVVAPLKLARGIQNKVLEAMAMARPVVASTAAAEGIDHQGTLRVGATVGDIADAVNALLADPVAAEALGAAARRLVIERYGWAAAMAPLDALLSLPTSPGRRLPA